MQWDTSDHDWLEGRGPRLYLIHMIDDATSALTARFVTSDSTAENMGLLWRYVENNGRPLAFYTDKASHFQTTPKTSRHRSRVERDAKNCRRHRSDGGCGSWGSPGLRRTPHKQKGEWSAASPRRGTGW